MKIKKYFEISALICGLSAIIWFVYVLILDYGRPIIFFEPHPYIRIIEIIWGVLAIPFLIKLVRDKVRNNK